MKTIEDQITESPKQYTIIADYTDHGKNEPGICMLFSEQKPLNFANGFIFLTNRPLCGVIRKVLHHSVGYITMRSISTETNQLMVLSKLHCAIF